MMKSTWCVAVASLLLLAACGDPPPEDDVAPPSTTPHVLEVTCAEDGTTEIGHDTAQVGPAGLDVPMRNLTGEGVSLNGIGWDFGEGDSTETVPIKPGTVKVACWAYSQHEGKEPKGLPIEIVDPEGLWVDLELQCRGDMVQSIISDHFFASPGEKGDPVEIARGALNHLDDDDVVERAGYPEQRNPVVRVVRDGRTIATVSLDRSDEGGYLVGGASICDASGIRFG